ncbi:MAG: DNA-3-methyladenine glycosylase [Solirubrobacteraceae bacterium]|nr:DNA-3-methyladenine glycosylase [Solirubrobacteraceae bacterium]
MASSEPVRCWPTTDPLYIEYHDDEWGRPDTDERTLHEKMVLEGFQSGLSWVTILRKRPGFRAAFADFDPEVVSDFGDDDVARLMADAGIVRNRRKIEAAIVNARATVALRDDGGLARLIWSFRPEGRHPVGAMSELPAQTPESKALASELKRRGFVFVGPTTMYALMQACGIVNDHLAGCWVRDEVQVEQRSAVAGLA